MRPIEQLRCGPAYSWREHGDKMLITVVPPEWAKMGNGASIELTADQFKRFLEWRKGEAIMEVALPELSLDQREILISGIGPDDWKKLEETMPWDDL
jgi:hypothetical protein